MNSQSDCQNIPRANIFIVKNADKDIVFVFKEEKNQSRKHRQLNSSSNTSFNTKNGPLPVLMFKARRPVDMRYYYS